MVSRNSHALGPRVRPPGRRLLSVAERRPRRPVHQLPVYRRAHAHPISIDPSAICSRPHSERDSSRSAPAVRSRYWSVSQRAGYELKPLRQGQVSFRRAPRPSHARGHDPEHRRAPALARRDRGGLCPAPSRRSRRCSLRCACPASGQGSWPQPQVHRRQQEGGDDGCVRKVGLEDVAAHELGPRADAGRQGASFRKLHEAGSYSMPRSSATPRRRDHQDAVTGAEVDKAVVRV